MLPIVAIICGSVISGIKMYFVHSERVEKIRQGIDPDRPSDDEDDTSASHRETVIKASA